MPERFYLNGHSIGFRQQLELYQLYKTPSCALWIQGLNWLKKINGSQKKYMTIFLSLISTIQFSSIFISGFRFRGKFHRVYRLMLRHEASPLSLYHLTDRWELVTTLWLRLFYPQTDITELMPCTWSVVALAEFHDISSLATAFSNT